MNENRQKVYDALDKLSPQSWLFAIAAAKGPIEQMAMVVNPDPTADAAAMKAIADEIERLQKTQGREG